MPEKPLISIITPSLNQGKYLYSAMNSVLQQNNVKLEYLVVDGGSIDKSLSIIKKFTNDQRLVYWCSEHDEGHYDALNKGFAHSSGEIMAWLNSDDLYFPNTLSIVSAIFEQNPQIEWLTTTHHTHFNSQGEIILSRYVGGYNQSAFWQGNNLIGQEWFGRAIIQQESTFWRRSLWEKAGGFFETSYELAADFELWTRFFQYADLYAVDVPLAGIRKHTEQKTAVARDKYLAEARRAFFQAGGKPYGRIHSFFRRYLWYLAGYRSYQQMPAKLVQFLTKIGIFYPANVCVWQNGRWTIVNDYVI